MSRSLNPCGEGCGLGLADVAGGGLWVGYQGAGGGAEDDEEADEGADGGVEGDHADDGPAPGVEQQAAQGFAFEQGGYLAGEFGVGGVGLGGGADLGVGLAAGDAGQVAVDEPVGVGLGFGAGVDFLAGVALQVGELRGGEGGAGCGGEGDVLGGELGVDHVEPEVAAVEQQAAADPEYDGEDEFDDSAG